MISDQVKFFFNYLKQELQELNLLEARANPGNKQSSVRGGYQNQQGQFKSRYQNFNTIEQRSFGQQQPGPNASRGMGYLPQMNQQFQQTNQHHQQNTPNQQQGNQGFQRKVGVTYFSCPLGCNHDVPWGSLSGCSNFMNMSPQLRKDTVEKVRASKCCLKTKGRQHDPDSCKSVLCQCGRSPAHSELICPNQRVQMNSVQTNFQEIECDEQTALQHLSLIHI